MTDPLPPDSSQQLSDPSYRASMLGKIEALISVLQIARAKVVANLDSPGVDPSRLTRVKRQVENTLEVCRKAQTALRDAAPISDQEILSTDLDALCSRLAALEVS